MSCVYGCVPACAHASMHACCIMYIDVVYMHMYVYCVDHVCSVYAFVGMYTECASLGVLQYILHWEHYTTLATCVGGEIENGVLFTTTSLHDIKPHRCNQR